MLDPLGSALAGQRVVARCGQEGFDSLAELGHSRVVVHRAFAAIDAIQDGGNFQQARADFQIVLVQQFGSIHKAKRRVGRSEVRPNDHATAGTETRPWPRSRPYAASIAARRTTEENRRPFRRAPQGPREAYRSTRRMSEGVGPVGVLSSGRREDLRFVANLAGWAKRGACGLDNGQGEFPLLMDWRRADAVRVDSLLP